MTGLAGRSISSWSGELRPGVSRAPDAAGLIRASDLYAGKWTGNFRKMLCAARISRAPCSLPRAISRSRDPKIRALKSSNDRVRLASLVAGWPRGSSKRRWSRGAGLAACCSTGDCWSMHRPTCGRAMFASAQRSPETSADYARETSRLVAQYFCENPQDEPRAPLVQTANWFLNSHGRWAQNTIRGFAAALHQEMGSVLDYDTFDPDSEEASILWRLKNERPDPVSKTKKSKKNKQIAHQQKVAVKKTKRKKYRKSIPMRELRALVSYFRSEDGEFSLWIAGYIMLASRLAIASSRWTKGCGGRRCRPSRSRDRGRTRWTTRSYRTGIRTPTGAGAGTPNRRYSRSQPLLTPY